MNVATRGAEMRIRGRRFVWGERTYVMGIVNASPDSFSGDGLSDPELAAAHACRELCSGADMVDIGAESTRPGHTPISPEEELRRLLPVVRRVRAIEPQAAISIDTFKADVFRAAHAAGGDVLNSIWGLDDALLEAARECGAPVVLMHNKRLALYEGDVVDEVLAYLSGQALRALRAGIPPERIVLDPGIGFGKLPDHNVALLGALDRLVALGFPTLLGVSRKSTIGRLTGQPVGARAFGTAAAVALAIGAGVDIVRVHDVAEMRDVVAVADAVRRGWRPPDWNPAR
jgi:dihydropteroate synthase